MSSPRVFISYSHKDEVWKDRLVTHLGVLVQDASLELWDDRRIAAGDNWLPEIQNAIRTCDVALLLISADFLTSNFILKKEVPPLLQRRASEGIRLVPVILRPCAWNRVTWLSGLQARPKDGKPLSAFSDHGAEEALTALAEELLILPDSVPSPRPTVASARLATGSTAAGATAARKWILVAGTGKGELPDKLVQTSQRLGRELAKAGFGLISGGWQGVDHLVARAFAQRLQEAGERLADRLVHIVERGWKPDFPGGRVRFAPSEDEAWKLSIVESDAVVLLGGIGGTAGTGEMARRMGKPVLPVADTRERGHADAYDVYFEILETWQSQPVTGLTESDFSRLAEPAPEVVGEIVHLLRKLFVETPASTVSGVALFDEAHGQRDWHVLRPTTDSGYGQLKIATERRCTVTNLAPGQDLNAASLRGVKILVLAAGPQGKARLTPQTIVAVNEYVRHGGGLLVLGTYTGDWHHEANFNDLIREYGMRLNGDVITKSDTDGFIQGGELSPQSGCAVEGLPVNNPISPGAAPIRGALLRDVESVLTLSSCSLYVDADAAIPLLQSSPEIFILDPDPIGTTIRIRKYLPKGQASVVLAAASKTHRVVVVGSWKTFLDEFIDDNRHQNAQFYQNILEWMTQPGTSAGSR